MDLCGGWAGYRVCCCVNRGGAERLWFPWHQENATDEKRERGPSESIPTRSVSRRTWDFSEWNLAVLGAAAHSLVISIVFVCPVFSSRRLVVEIIGLTQVCSAVELHSWPRVQSSDQHLKAAPLINSQGFPVCQHNFFHSTDTLKTLTD